MDVVNTGVDTVATGLQLYAKISAYFGLGVTIIVFLFALWVTVRIARSKYVRADAQIVYQRKVGDGFKNCGANENGCSHYVEYKADRVYKLPVQYPRGSQPTVGKTSVYYPNANKSLYTISSFSPLFLASIADLVLLCIILGSIGYIYVISKYKSIGALMGGVDAVRDISRLMK